MRFFLPTTAAEPPRIHHHPLLSKIWNFGYPSYPWKQKLSMRVAHNQSSYTLRQIFRCLVEGKKFEGGLPKGLVPGQLIKWEKKRFYDPRLNSTQPNPTSQVIKRKVSQGPETKSKVRPFFVGFLCCSGNQSASKKVGDFLRMPIVWVGNP